MKTLIIFLKLLALLAVGLYSTPQVLAENSSLKTGYPGIDLLGGEAELDGCVVTINSEYNCEIGEWTLTAQITDCTPSSASFTWTSEADPTFSNTNSMITVSVPGIYGVSVFIQQNSGPSCQVGAGITLTPPDFGLEISSQENISCHGLSNGSVTIHATGETGPYSYELDGQTNDDGQFDNLARGTYTVTATDENGCVASIPVTIDEPAELVLEFDANNVRCKGDNNGSITAIGSGGTGTIDYEWDNGVTNPQLTELAVGIYRVTITDQNDCTKVASVEITEPDNELIAAINMSTDVTCFGGDDGTATATATGGAGNYTFSWGNGGNSSTNNQLSGGTHSVTITDGNGCEKVVSVNIVEPDPELISDYPTNATFQDNTAQELMYTAESSTATLSWKIVGTPKCIDLAMSTLPDANTSGSLLSFTFVLENDRVPGSMVIEVSSGSGECGGQAVQTSILVSPDDAPIFVSEIFSPNDDGDNDEWEIIFPDIEDADNYSITVFSRSGGTVYESNSMFLNWTGDGCPNGAYYYVIEDKTSKKKYTGAVSIVR